MDTDVVLTLITNLARSRFELSRINYQSMLESDKKIDKKEVGALMAGYKKAQHDLDEILMGIAEI